MYRTLIAASLALPFLACEDTDQDLPGTNGRGAPDTGPDGGLRDGGAPDGGGADGGVHDGGGEDGGRPDATPPDAGEPMPVLSRRPNLISDTGDFLDALGWAVAFLNDDLLAGAPRDELDGQQGGPECGALIRFRPDAQGLYQQFDRLSPPQCEDDLGFGKAIAATDSHIAVGAPSDTGTPRVFLYEVVGDAFVLAAELTGAPGSGFGTTLTLGTDTLVVGAPRTNGERGAVSAVKIDESGLRPMPLTTSTVAAGARQGQGLALHADGWLAVGAPNETGGGTVSLFRRIGDSWNEISIVRNPNASDARAGFGQSLAFDETSLWVGSPGTGDGSIYRYPLGSTGLTLPPVRVTGPTGSGAGLGASVGTNPTGSLVAFGGPFAGPGFARGLVLVATPDEERGWFAADSSASDFAFYGFSVAVSPLRPVVAIGWPGWLPAGASELDDGNTGAIAIYELETP